MVMISLLFPINTLSLQAERNIRLLKSPVSLQKQGFLKSGKTLVLPLMPFVNGRGNPAVRELRLGGGHILQDDSQLLGGNTQR
jgi:hypothetical protein